ncbi:phenoloxidase-activating factor 2-like [Drosophila gunungcola]|uniref:phenoloxidase-activating factor 2-like n=1 Tax=Drosophila gunungcola TaxID=103775 RepID=UPI0022E7488C|nr:phenoloxidase-activating factor 2-like [Drosophila gunungcola]
MTMKAHTSLLLLLCAITTLRAQVPTTRSMRPWQDFAVTPIPRAVEPSEPQSNPKIGPTCECTPYHQCDPSPDGLTQDYTFDKFGLQVIRHESKPHCTVTVGVLALCCPLNRVRRETINPKPKGNRGCGIRNVGGLDIDLQGATDYESDMAEFPWTVAIMQSGNYSFTGSLIHPQVVLTAAHRVRMWETYTVRAGEWDFKTESERLPYQEKNVLRIIKHPRYNNKNLANDVALVILEEPFKLDDHINVICLPKQELVPPPFTTCIANGWGKDAFGDSGKYMAIMKRVPLNIVESNYCQNRLRKTRLGPSFNLDNSFICAGGQHDVDTCQGDGGAPLACPLGEPAENRFQLSGLVSWGIGCNDELPAAYANVALARDWIDEQMLINGFDSSSYSA